MVRTTRIRGIVSSIMVSHNSQHSDPRNRGATFKIRTKIKNESVWIATESFWKNKLFAGEPNVCKLPCRHRTVRKKKYVRKKCNIFKIIPSSQKTDLVESECNSDPFTAYLQAVPLSWQGSGCRLAAVLCPELRLLGTVTLATQRTFFPKRRETPRIHRQALCCRWIHNPDRRDSHWMKSWTRIDFISHPCRLLEWAALERSNSTAALREVMK